MVDIQVLPRSQLIFPSKTWFLRIYLHFQWQKLLKNQYFSHSESKSYQINSFEIKIFPTKPKAHSNSFENFSYNIIQCSVKKSFNIQELLHCKSKHHGSKHVHPFLLKAFQRHQEHDLKHPSLVDFISTKQNKTNYLPS